MPPRQSIAEIKAAGRAKLKASRAAAAAETASHASADELWRITFEHIFDTEDSQLPDLAEHDVSIPVMVLVPGFSSWHAITQQHVDEYRTFSLSPRVTVAIKWPCGAVVWSGEDAQTDAAAAWQTAHEATPAASASVTKLLSHLKEQGRRVIVVAHSLGARVSLGARGADGILLLGPAVDCDVLSEADKGEFATADRPIAVVRSTNDEVLSGLYGIAEYARCGRHALDALGSVGCDSEEGLGVSVLDVSAEVTKHGPFDYLGVEAVRGCLEGMLVPS